MKQIASWTLGSFFRTIGRFLFYLLVGYLLFNFIDFKEIKLPGLFNVLDVYAATTDDWFYKIENYSPNIYYFYNHTSNGYTEVSGTLGSGSFYFYNTDINDDPIIRDIYWPQYNGANIHTNGFSISFYVNQLFAQGYLYNLTTYVCFGEQSADLTPSVSTGYSATNAIGHTMGYHVSVKQKLSNVIAASSYDNLTACYAITSLISSTGTYPWVNLKFTNPTNINRTIKVIGYDIEALGIYNASLQQYVQNAINNSGLATASSVSDVNRAVDSVRSELENVGSSIDAQTQQQQENHEETIDTLTDDSAPNISGLNNSAGWLPAGPVDSILNLPLSFLTNLNNSLSQNCSPVTLPLPYVNENIQLPCLNSIYAQINGLPNWLNTIGTIASAFILFGYLISLYKYIDDTLTFRENNYIDNWSGV